MAESNPFEALLMTPENLSLMRQAQFNAENQGENFWVRSAGRAGLEARNALLQRGIALGPEDQRALTTQAIMQGSQKRLADLVKTGKLDPMTAQEQVITETMSAFMQAGDYAAAQSLLPGLNQIRTYRAEIDKLRSEEAENKAQAYSATATGDVRYLRADAQIEADEALAEQRRAAGRASDATARLRDRTDPNRSRGGGGKGEGPSLSAAAEREQQQGIAGTLNLFNTMNDLIQIVEQFPFVTSKAAGVHTDIQQTFTGINNYFASTGKGAKEWDIVSLSDDPKDARGGAQSPRAIAISKEAQIRQKAAKLGVPVTVFRSAVINAAYALARANDPGGRLSNNDFDFAMQMLGAVEDPAAARASFANLARQAHAAHKARMRSIGSKNVEKFFSEQDADVDATYKAFTERYGKLGTPEGAPKPDKDGWIVIDGVKIRKKQ